jgi:isoleucyl-tRNA synthetase
LLSEAEWAEVLIASTVVFARPEIGNLASARVADGSKCARCWRVLPEVGQQPGHPSLCARCSDAVESGLVCQQAA